MAVVKIGRKSREWVSKVELAKKELAREQKDWRRNRALLLGLAPAGVTDWASVNLAWAAFETMVGVCYQQTPEVIVRETNAACANAAKLLTAAIHEDLDLMRSRYHTRLAIMDVFWAGRGVVMEKMLGDVTTATHRWIGESGQAESADYPSVSNKRTVLTRLHPNSIIQDPHAVMGDFSDAAWLGFEFYPTVAELRDSPEFTISAEMLKTLPKLRVQPSMESPLGQQLAQPSVLRAGTDEGDEFARVRVWEIWDRVNKRKLYVPNSSDEIIGEKEWPLPLYYNGQLRFPVSTMYFNEHPDKAFPIAEISTAAPQIEQFQLLFRTMVRDAIQRWRKYLVQGDLLQKGHIARITAGPAHTTVSINPQKVGDSTKLDLSRVIMPIPDSPVKADVLGAMNVVKGLVHEIFGAGDFASAGFRSTRSATEAAALTDFLKVRMTNRTENIDTYHKELGTTHALILQQTLDEARVIQLTDAKGVEQFHTFDKKMIQGDFKFRVTAGSSQSRNTEVARQESLAFYQQTLPIVSQAGGNVRPLIDWIAPFYRIPPHIVDQLFAGHREALQRLALMMAAIHMGARVAGAQLIEAISLAVNTGLSEADMGAIMQKAMAAPPQGGGAPGGLPGSNAGPGASGAVGAPA